MTKETRDALRPNWSLQQAIQEQVNKEDMVARALRESEAHTVIPPMPHTVGKQAPLPEGHVNIDYPAQRRERGRS
jgi:hypothetical protein